jgi:hypothetical protein
MIRTTKFSLGCDLTACTKEDRGTKTIKKPNARSTETLNGVDLFKKYCAVWHGRDANGIDRRRKFSRTGRRTSHSSQKKGGSFPELQVMDYIKGRMWWRPTAARICPSSVPLFPDEFRPGFGPRSDLGPIQVGGATAGPSESPTRLRDAPSPNPEREGIGAA